MGEIAATEFKARCLELMDQVATRRESFLITKRGRPVARLVPVERQPQDSAIGCFQGSVSIQGDITSPPLPPGSWETLDEWDRLETRKPGARRKGKSTGNPRKR